MTPHSFPTFTVLLARVPLRGNRNMDTARHRFVGLVRQRQESVHCGAYFLGLAMNLTDATLVLLLAARIHGTDEAVRASAKSVVKKLPRSKRDLIYKVIESRSPLELVDFLAQNLDAE